MPHVGQPDAQVQLQASNAANATCQSERLQVWQLQVLACLGVGPLLLVLNEHDVPVGGRNLQAQAPAHAWVGLWGDLLRYRLQQRGTCLVHHALAVLIRFEFCEIPARLNCSASLSAAPEQTRRYT